MTEMTLSVQLFPRSVTAEELQQASSPSKTIVQLDGWRCAPHELTRWARAEGIPVHFIDNCWVRVPVDRFQAQQFVEAFNLSPEVASFIALPIHAEGQIVIVAEEF